MFEKIRKESLSIAETLGYPINLNLPLLDSSLKLRGKSELVTRILCLHAVIAASYGFPKHKALSWLKKNELDSSLSTTEISFLLSDKTNEEHFQPQTESVWALLWILKRIDELDFTVQCSDSLVTMLPNLKDLENIEGFQNKLSVLNQEDVIQSCDLAYCLHWGLVEASMHLNKIPGTIPINTVIDRRRALEWALSKDDWDDVNLDT